MLSWCFYENKCSLRTALCLSVSHCVSLSFSLFLSLIWNLKAKLSNQMPVQINGTRIMRIIFYNIIQFNRIRLEAKSTSLTQDRHSLIGKFETNFKMPKSFISKFYPNPTLRHFGNNFPNIFRSCTRDLVFVGLREPACYKIYIYSFFSIYFMTGI